jgi:hypothetical protein
MRAPALALVALLPGSAAADEWAATGKLGTLGLGVELSRRLSDDWSGRLGVNAFTVSRNVTSSGIDYEAELKFQTLALLADHFPWRGSQFRVAFGLMYNGNQGNFSGRPTDGTYLINNVRYRAEDIASVAGSVTFRRAAPYLGIGWGNGLASGRGWNVSFDLGALYQGMPKAELSVACGIALTPGQCAALQDDAAAEKQEAERPLREYRWWPVVSTNASYRF